MLRYKLSNSAISFCRMRVHYEGDSIFCSFIGAQTIGHIT